MGKIVPYTAQAVYDHNRDRFYQCLFVPQEAREALYAVLALDVELAHIRRAAKEEVMGHMRHAWWQESLEMMVDGGRPREHPVFLALEPLINGGRIPKDMLMALTLSYREAYPELPTSDKPLESLCRILLTHQQISGWERAGDIIQKHRARFGGRKNSWLRLKLLFAGAGR